MVFDSLWTELLAAERSSKDLAKEGGQAFLQAREKERECAARFVRASVIDHDAASFEAQVPIFAPGTAGYAHVLSILEQIGYGHEEVVLAAASGVAHRQFVAEEFIFSPSLKWSGASQDTIRFYERCQPDRAFLTRLIVSIFRFQAGEILTPAHFWRAGGVKEESLPLPFDAARRGA
jgi:hypothetical protein